MSAHAYYESISAILKTIHDKEMPRLHQAGEAIAAAFAADRRAYLFGSGHSVIPVMDVFPRYGSFVGFVPLYDPRLMWHNVVGPGGARELLWLERREGYIENFLLVLRSGGLVKPCSQSGYCLRDDPGNRV